MMKIIKLFCFAAIFLTCSVNLFAQTPADETEKIKVRAENILQTIREGKWDEAYKFVAVIIQKEGKITRKRLDVPENATEELKKRIATTFRNLYTLPKPGKAVNVILDEKDKTLALVEYWHEDLDGFNMILVDGQWYYAMDIYQ